MDSILRYNYYIDNMPGHDINSMSFEQEQKILDKVRNNSSFNS